MLLITNNKYTNVTQDLGITADFQRTKFKTQTQIFNSNFFVT